MLIPNIRGSLSLVLRIKSNEPVKICLTFEKGRKLPLQLPSAKERSRMRVYFNFCLFIFPSGDRIEPIVVEYRERTHSNGN